MPVFSRFTHYTDPLAVQILRRHMGGRPYLVSLILVSVALGLNAIASIIQMIESGSLLSSIASTNSGTDTAAVAIGTIVGYVISVLFVTSAGSLGLVSQWMIYAAAHSRKSPMGTAGFTMQKILAIVELALLGVYALLACFVAFIFSLLIEFMGALAGAVGNGIAVDMGTGTVLTVLFVLLGAVLAYGVFAAIASLQTANRMKTTARTGLPGKPIPLFYIISLFIGIGFSIFTLIATVFGLVSTFSFGTLLTLLAALPSVVAAILQAIVIIRYRSELKELQNFTPSNAYVPAPQASGELRPDLSQEIFPHNDRNTD